MIQITTRKSSIPTISEVAVNGRDMGSVHAEGLQFIAFCHFSFAKVAPLVTCNYVEALRYACDLPLEPVSVMS